MRKNHRLLSALLFLSAGALAQSQKPVSFKNRIITAEANVRNSYVDSFNRKAVRFNNRTVTVLQFSKAPDPSLRQMLADNGIELLDYISSNAYTTSIKGNLNAAVLAQLNVRSIIPIEPEQKMQQGLARGIVPVWASKVAGTIDLWISFPRTYTLSEVQANLRALNVEVLSDDFKAYRILSLRLAINRIKELASYPFIEFVQPAPKGDQPFLYNSRYGSKANQLNASLADGGKGLNGAGVVVGVGDNADVQSHVDFAGRLINRSFLNAAGHGTHVTGIVGGAGNINPLYRGYASKATIISQAYSGILINAAAYVQDYGMVITNNSYGDVVDCGLYGTYDLQSRIMDQMAYQLPQLTNVFAAGNQGGETCAPYAFSYRTVVGGYQSAKNVIAVGATNDSGGIAYLSSRGPVRDGRIKPEITAHGEFVASTWPVNGYSYNNGTSMSSPAVAGGLALLYERYRQLHGGANPSNALMKAILCNGATDRGAPGPDYQYGFGWMNLLRSLEIMENNHYFQGNSTTGSTNSQTITIPANTAQVKVMLYWNDPAASVLSPQTLVNDLDLTVNDPSAGVILPKILDTVVANVGNTAINGADHINNIEQVVIDNPIAGTYTLNVKGTAINQNPSQEYFLVYDIIPVQLQLTSPAGGETLAPSTNAYDMAKINWEANGFTSGTATISFSADNGTTWNTVASNVAIDRSIFTWWIPNSPTNQGRVKITKDGSGETSISNAFTILAQPAVSLASNQCEGYASLNWTTVSGATDYEVMILRGEEMQPVATTTGTSYTFNGLSKDSVYWMTVRARIGGKPGPRGIALSRQPNSGSCLGSLSDNDLALDAIVAPATGRRFTSTELTASTPVSIRIKNLDDATVTGFDVRYSIDGGTSWVTESVSASVAGGATYTHVFATPANLSLPGTYSLVVQVVNHTADPVAQNNTAWRQVRQLDNQPLNLTSPFLDQMETAADAVYNRDTTGLNGLDRYDFSRSTTAGRLRSFLNSGIAYSGSKALTLDANVYLDPNSLPGNTNYLYGTFNLSNYNPSLNDLRLDFQYLNHGQIPGATNKVWIRGNDTQPWIDAYDLYANQEDAGFYKRSGSIELSDLLAAAGQNFGTSFQVRWGQFGYFAATDKENAAGYSFDDVRLYEVFNDLQLVSIDAPLTSSCALTNTTPISISVRNSSNNTVTSIPVRYRINGGSWTTETIPSIAGNTTLSYTFIGTADFSLSGPYQIESVVDFPVDTFHDNDTSRVSVMNAPVVSAFPYLQNFEAGTGFWFTEGKHNSWEYGTPASQKINGAASGAKAWKTRLTGSYNNNELSYLYSPCFNVSGLTTPTLSFSLALDIEDCGPYLCDGAWVEYSGDGVNWTKLGAAGSGTNWYNKTADQLWSKQDDHKWHVATTALPAGLTNLRLRFVFASDPGLSLEGIAIDDIHIYDNTMGIYSGTTISSPITQTVSGNSWIDFTSGGKLVASLQPNNQNLGATDVQAYINAAPVRYDFSQYYHDRNLTIKPANTILADSVTVRFYFLDTEAEKLVQATGCSYCSRPSSAYELGVSKYSDADDSFENGTIADNDHGNWLFIPQANVVKVPFDKGYYAEFKVKDFSEFWLNNGGFYKNTPLPVRLVSFEAQRKESDVLLTWKVASEENVARYDIEVARTTLLLQQGQFEKIGSVNSAGNTTQERTYSFTDQESGKGPVRYYRLKMLERDGSFTYSPVRTVWFDDNQDWSLYPNPSKGLFNLLFRGGDAEKVNVSIYDARGALVKEYHTLSNGIVQKLHIDLTGAQFTPGVYLLRININGKEKTFRLYKQ